MKERRANVTAAGKQLPSPGNSSPAGHGSNFLSACHIFRTFPFSSSLYLFISATFVRGNIQKGRIASKSGDVPQKMQKWKLTTIFVVLLLGQPPVFTGYKMFSSVLDTPLTVLEPQRVFQVE